MKAPTQLQFEDGSADEDGRPNETMPTTMTTVTIAEAGSGVARMVIETTSPSKEAMEQILEMGMERGSGRR